MKNGEYVMNKKNNQRAQQTQKRIKEIFLEMLSTKKINQVTVQDICRVADINRTTFYSHFTDIYDLMKAIEKEQDEKIRQIFYLEADNTYHNMTEDNLLSLLRLVYEHRVFYQVYLTQFSDNQPLCDQFIAKWNDDFSEQLRNQSSELSKMDLTELKYRFEYYKAGIIGTIQAWLNSDCKETPEELAFVMKKFLSL